MTTETTTENKSTDSESNNVEKNTSDNKSVLTPLVKYAVIAVIMVSIIVTTVIMLDNQLNTVSEQIAVIESEVAGTKTIKQESAFTENQEASPSSTTVVSATDVSKSEVAEADSTEQQTNEVATKLNDTPVEAVPGIEQTSEHALVDSSAVSASAITPTSDTNSLARSDVYKNANKQRMTETFARIKAREAQQLDRYKSNQNMHVERLRMQNTSPQVIEAVIVRNERLFRSRQVSLQKNQMNREQMLNRI